MKYFFLSLSFFLFISAFLPVHLSGQTQPGLHVAENQKVLFGQDTSTTGIKLMLWRPKMGALRSGIMNDAWKIDKVGYSSTAFGEETVASGHYSFAVGRGTWANSYGEFSIGRYSLQGGAKSVWDTSSSDVVFEIGNGTGSNAANRSNMFTIQKSGNVKIGNLTSPLEKIDEKLIVDGGIVLSEAKDLSPAPGTIQYNQSTQDYEGWDAQNSKWVSLTSGSNSNKPPHLNQPNSLGQGLAWSSVSQYKAHYADNGDAVIFWKDDGDWFISKFINGQWSHPYSSDETINVDYKSSDINASGKIIYTYESGNNLYVREISASGSFLLMGPIATGIANSKSEISINDNGDYFVSFLKDIGGQIRVHVVGNTMSTPIQISADGSDAYEHRISLSENGDAVIYWMQPTTIGSSRGMYRSELIGGSWTTPTLSNYIENTDDYIFLRNLESSSDGQFMLLYDRYEDETGFDEGYIHHKILDKRNGIWNTYNFISTSTYSSADFLYYYISGSMSDNGNSIYTYYEEDFITPYLSSNGMYKYEVSGGSWQSGGLVEGPQTYRTNDISDTEELVLSSRYYCGGSKYYLNLDGFNLTQQPNLNEGIGIDGISANSGRVKVNNSGSYLITWIQNGKLLYLII